MKSTDINPEKHNQIKLIKDKITSNNTSQNLNVRKTCNTCWERGICFKFMRSRYMASYTEIEILVVKM